MVRAVADSQVAPTVIITPAAFATAFAPCISYASILSSCAAVTTSFYYLDYDQQAACVCYQASTNSAACQAVPTLDLSYDTYEYGCYDFFARINVTRITQAMDSAAVLPGPVLCNWASAEFSIPLTLAATTLSCRTPTPTPTAPAFAQITHQGGEAARLLTASDRNILVSVSFQLISTR